MTQLSRIDEDLPTQAAARLSQELAQFSPAVALSVISALQPQMSELQTRVNALQHAAVGADKNCQSAQALCASEVVDAVTALLTPRFDDLENRAASATSTEAATPRLADANSEHEIVATLSKELAPQITEILETSLGEALTARMPDLEQCKTPKQRPNSNVNFRCDPYSSDESFGATSEASQAMPGLPPSTTIEFGPSDAVSEMSKSHAALLRRTTHGLSETSSVTTVGKLKRGASLSQNTLPEKAFVVNFRRLVEVHKMLAILHEFICSTAIATLTLVAAGNWRQLGFSILFVVNGLFLFAVHEVRYDRMEIEDYLQLVELLEDDDGVCGGKEIQNPNRLLKGLTLCSGRSRRRIALLTSIIGVLLCSILWINIFWSWADPPADGMWMGVFSEEDRTTKAALTLVGTAMVLFHLAFECIYWRETQCVMPLDGKSPLDPRVEGSGLPFQYRWFGLPSMWFTSQKASDDLRLWITHCCWEDCSHMAKIFPEEMALLALNPDGASYLRRTLASAKLFGMSNFEFLTRDETGKPRPVNRGEDPEELGLDFVLFDSASEQFLQPAEDYRGSMMRLLTRDLP